MQVLEQRQFEPEASAVIIKALGNAAQLWQINNRTLGHIIGTSEASVSRLLRGQGSLSENTTQWQLALLFLRVFRGLNAYLGGDFDNQIAWLNAHNRAFDTTPLLHMQSVVGLVDVVQYIDALRGQ